MCFCGLTGLAKGRAHLEQLARQLLQIVDDGIFGSSLIRADIDACESFLALETMLEYAADHAVAVPAQLIDAIRQAVETNDDSYFDELIPDMLSYLDRIPTPGPSNLPHQGASKPSTRRQ